MNRPQPEPMEDAAAPTPASEQKRRGHEYDQQPKHGLEDGAGIVRDREINDPAENRVVQRVGNWFRIEDKTKPGTMKAMTT
jgi:hypothetical protein